MGNVAQLQVGPNEPRNLETDKETSKDTMLEAGKTVVSEQKQLFGEEETVVSEQKQLFGEEETVVSEKNQLFERQVSGLRVSEPTKEKMMQLYEQLGGNAIFSRADIMRITGITSSPAGELIRKLKKENLVESVTGHGKGKYRFKI